MGIRDYIFESFLSLILNTPNYGVKLKKGEEGDEPPKTLLSRIKSDKDEESDKED